MKHTTLLVRCELACHDPSRRLPRPLSFMAICARGIKMTSAPLEMDGLGGIFKYSSQPVQTRVAEGLRTLLNGAVATFSRLHT